jgi:glycosyltransferase involved in cell wall biosynthesis
VLTVLLATHNGERTLQRVLEAHGNLEAPEGGWKLVVVDNASTDATREVVLSFKERLRLTYLFEAQRGQNRARNIALSSVVGDLVVFTDDDAIPRPDWLVRMRQAADAHPEFEMFGGTILPRWETEPEPWIRRCVPLSAAFALTDPAWEEGPIRDSWVFSPNMAIRAAVFREGCRFDETFGPREGSYPMGSETELTRRLAGAGLRGWHVKEAIVEHIIRPFQVTSGWLLSRAMRYGRGQYRLSIQNERLRRAVLPPLAGPLRGILSHGARLALAQLSRDPERVFRSRWDMCCSIGSVLEAYAVYRERRPD